MIRARIRVVNEEGSFTVVVFADSLRRAEQSAGARYPESAVKVVFPIEPEGFFASTHDGSARAGFEPPGRLTDRLVIS